jgi:hypothetical protein
MKLLLTKKGSIPSYSIFSKPEIEDMKKKMRKILGK